MYYTGWSAADPNDPEIPENDPDGFVEKQAIITQQISMSTLHLLALHYWLFQINHSLYSLTIILFFLSQVWNAHSDISQWTQFFK